MTHSAFDAAVALDDDPNAARTRLDNAIEGATEALLRRQQQDGHFIFDLEADAAIPADYMLVKHFLGEVDRADEQRHAAYLRRRQEANGGWPMLIGGPISVSASVKCYFALKAAGDPIDAPHMRRARNAILAEGGAAQVNVFTRIMLAFFGIVPWRAVPVMPVEIMHAPRWFPFSIWRISFWARDTLVPLMVLMALKPQAANRGVTIDELFIEPAHTIEQWPRGDNQVGRWGRFFEVIDAALRWSEPLFPRGARRRAIGKAIAFARQRLNGEDGFGAIIPSIAYTLMMFKTIGEPEGEPDMLAARAALEKLVAQHGDEAFCQPCLSPVWDTVLSAEALLESNLAIANPDVSHAAKRAIDWLVPRQVLDLKGDWSVQRPTLQPGGWAFMYNNPAYPDLDDTAVIVMALDRCRKLNQTAEYDNSIARAKRWVLGMQSRNGGWASYDADNTSTYLNCIPFADHGALLDPPTSDVTARCLAMLGQLKPEPADQAAIERGLAFLLREQHPEGSWFGRWGINYIYGTWSALCALSAAGAEQGASAICRAVDWLAAIQNDDGGWGEDDAGYAKDYTAYRMAPSTASQTAWALLGLMAVGQVDTLPVRRGIDYLLSTQDLDGFWFEDRHTATGFPRVFYLRYDGYPKFFPLFALARYRNLMSGSGRLGAGFQPI